MCSILHINSFEVFFLVIVANIYLNNKMTKMLKFQWNLPRFCRSDSAPAASTSPWYFLRLVTSCYSSVLSEMSFSTLTQSSGTCFNNPGKPPPPLFFFISLIDDVSIVFFSPSSPNEWNECFQTIGLYVKTERKGKKKKVFSAAQRGAAMSPSRARLATQSGATAYKRPV